MKSSESSRLSIFAPAFASVGRRAYVRLLTCAVALLAAQTVPAQVLNTNLIVNGDAEVGPAGTPTTAAASIPSWTRATGNINVLPYGLAGYLLLSDPAPADHGFQYFSGSPSGGSSTLTQIINVSAAASTISGGNVKYTASAFLGDYLSTSVRSQVTVAFQNANGQTFSTATLGPDGYTGVGMSMQQQIGLVPPGTAQITVTLTISAAYGVADSLSLVLAPLGTTPGAVLNTNLILNGGAEAGAGAAPTAFALNVPGWSTTSGVSVAPYGGTGWIQVTDPSPADRGVNLFLGGFGGGASMYQDLDVSPAASLIDAGQVTFDVSAWLGALTGGYISPTLTYTFFDWSGTQVAPTAKIGPPSHTGTELLQTSFSGPLPSGTRRVHILVTFPYNYSMADDISFILTSPATSHPAFFTGEASLGSGVYYLQLPNGNVFGYYNYQYFPVLYHYDLGFEYFIDANDGKGGAYLYDFASGHWLFTSPSYPFPYLYDFTLQSILYYYPNTSSAGRYTTNPRYFYNFATGKTITM